MLNLLHARTFLAVLSERGFRAAARDLKLSPSTVVEHIKQLEEDLAAPLLVRRHGLVELTSQGAAFAPLARAMLDTAARSRAIIARPALHVAASSNIGTYLLQSILTAFQASDPLAVDLWIGPNHEVAERLTNGSADAALMEWWSDRPDFRQHRWRREPLVVIVAPDHPWATRTTIEASELAGQPLLGGEPGTGTNAVLRKQLGPLADKLTAVRGLGSTEAVKRAVRAGRGISLVIEAAVSDEVRAGQLVALPLNGVELAKDLKIISPSGLPEAAPAMRFISFVLEEGRLHSTRGDGKALDVTAPCERSD
jgi:LysR family transcriptional regulator, low CO2-responsive transcriptional regulator